MLRFFISLLYLILLFGIPLSSGQSKKDSASRAVNAITASYKSGKLDNGQYLDQVYSTMQSLLAENIDFSSQELIRLLKPYKDAAINSKDKTQLRKYYAIFCNQAQMTGQYGEMLYYAEKIDHLEREIKNKPSLTGTTVIMDYYATHQNPHKVKEIYARDKKYLLGIAERVDKKEISAEEMIQTAIIFEKATQALYKLGDTLGGSEAKAAIKKIATTLKNDYHADNNIISNVNYLANLATYHAALTSEGPDRLLPSFRTLEQQLADSTTPEYLKQYIEPTLVDWKLAYYLHYKNFDSAQYYLKVYEEYDKVEGNLYNKFVLKKFKAMLAYNNASYLESADELFLGVSILDSFRATLVNDIDELLYAQAKAEEQQSLLQEATVKQTNTERNLLISGIIIIALILSGVFIIQYIRHKQKNRFLEFKLNMARNIHDETGPAFLYAQMLAKAERVDRQLPDKSELETQIDRTMEVIRHLSHDLKSSDIFKLGDLTTEIRNKLAKLNTNNQYKFQIDADIEKKQFISHLQFTHIKAILNECIANSIKHADFHNIRVSIQQDGKKLKVTYNDDGQGWEVNAGNNGIGLVNMEERVMRLNGKWEVENRYPNGYTIHFFVLLR
jgi:signal transduction histidine kinase